MQHTCCAMMQSSSMTAACPCPGSPCRAGRPTWNLQVNIGNPKTTRAIKEENNLQIHQKQMAKTLA